MACHQTGEPPQAVILGRMPQQPKMLGTEEDWTGITSSTKRRRLQNRLNQRAYRRRKKNDRDQEHKGISNVPVQPLNRDYSVVTARNPENSDGIRALHSPGMTIWEQFYSAISNGSINRQKLYRIAATCNSDLVRPKQIISDFEKWVEHCRVMGSPLTDHILVLVKFNVFRALMGNAKDLGIAVKECMDDDALSPYSDPHHPSEFIRPAPPALQSTSLQLEVCHHPWIDTIPIPGMRDNLLMAGNSYDDLRLCADLVGVCGESTDRSGMIVWGDPWDPASWEVTESFARAWGWTIRGCERLYDSTNNWRRRRGERPLSFKKLLCEGAREPD